MDVEILRALQLGSFDSPAYAKFLELRLNVRVDTYKQTVRFQRFVSDMLKLVPCSAKISGYNFDLIADVHAIITACSFRPSLRTPYVFKIRQFLDLTIDNCPVILTRDC